MGSNAPLLGIHDLFPFWSPDAPDLGCFVSNKHGLESYNFFVWGEPAPWNASGIITHQTYARVICGEAAYFQRARAVMLGGSSSMTDAIFAAPDYVLGGNFRPYPSDWVKWPVQSDNRMYWFVGEHRNPATTSWQRDAMVGHSFDIYEHGTLSTVHFDDTGGDRDLDDFILEVAVVRRRRWLDVLEPVAYAKSDIKAFEDKEFPKIKEAIRGDRRAEDESKAAAPRS
ncbi:MAG TPA: hypothetical protein VHK05_00255 [Candidatus Limnocylindrales bacterium]|jgi:hypothetical protein|nr:hypothetical protein [Candidatus Limnocylindrales bacterium]